MPIYTGDKMGFGVAPASGSGDSASEVGYSTSFDNVSHSATARTEHKWIVPKTARYNFEVWGADGGMGIRGDTNNNGGIPRYGRGGKVEASFLLDAGTEIGIMIGDNGLPCFDFNTNSYLNDGTGGWGGFHNNMAMADGGNSIYSKQEWGKGGSAGSGTHNWRGAGGGGGTIVRLFETTDDAGILIVAGGGGGAGSRGDQNNNSNNQGGSGGNANEKMNETQWGRRGYYAGDTSYGWPSGNANHAASGSSSSGGNGGNGYYAGGGGGGGGCGGGGGSATCTYCGSSAGSGGGCGSEGAKGNSYTGASGGAATSNPSTFTLVGAGGNMHNNNHGGGGGGGYRGGGAGYHGNGTGHAGGGGGGGASSYCMGTGNSYDVKGLNGLTANPRFTSEQKPMRLGNPGGGKVFIWEADKDPLGKNRPAEMTADKIQYLCRSQNGGASNSQRLYYIGSAGNGSVDDGGDNDYSCYNNYPYTTSTNACDAIVMEIGGNGLWELHSVTVGAGANAGSGRPNVHRCWVHVIEGTETGGVGIHTEKFDNNNPTGFNDPCNGWWAHYRSCAKQQNTVDGYIELFFEKPAVLNRGQKYTIALDWSCGGTNSTVNADGLTCMNNGAVSTRVLRGTGKGTCTWTGVTAYNGPHGLGTKNNHNNMETSASQGQMVHFGVRSVEIASGGGGGGGGSATYVTNGLIFNVDASDSSSYSGSGNTWTDIQGSNNVSLTNCSYSSSHGGGITFDGVNQWSIGEFTTPFTANQAHTWEVWTDGTWTTGWPGSPYTWILHNSSQGQSTGSSYLTIGIDSSNYFFGALDGRFTSMADANQTSTNSTVYHLILTWDGSTQIFYVDGNQGPSFSTPGYSSWQNSSSFNTTTTMGEAIGGNYRPLKGNIYSVRCWDRALSSSEVTTNWNGNKAKFGR